ncbi:MULTISPECIES: alkaline phosphatase family protein [Saliphagus]|uniref:Alkaline phosphatase family protein n=1 Tax=Saliphagus infecundisoli TaxID=1849069 RepID=A0ABD5QJE0_9EURY|nr:MULTISPECIES: alkaline phosphatase family protein [Saliphagus]
MSGSSATAERAFVLGLDGVPWDLIDRFTSEGALPNFARLREEGASGPLESTRPPTTPLAWPSIATGVRPDKHGVYGFQKLSGSYSHRMYTSRDRRQPALWEQLSPAAVGNVPMTFPPEEIDGALVAGMMTPSTSESYTHPPELRETVAERIPDYEIGLDYPDYADRLEEFPGAVSEILGKRRELMDLLLETVPDWRLAFFVYTAPDRFQHLVWDEAKIREHYRALDEIVGEVIEYTDRRNADLYVVSDHGFGPIDRLVYVNHLLEREGYLARREDDGTRGALSSLGISRDGVVSALSRVGVSEEQLVSVLPRTVVDGVAARIPGDHALYDADYARTKAFVHDAGNVYVNDTRRFEKGVVDPGAIPELKAELTELFESVTDGGEPVLAVFDGDDLFPTDADSPDLVVNGRRTYETRTAIAGELFGDPAPTAASHRSQGIALCRGPSIEAGARLEGADVTDIAPTLLHGLGRPVPDNADGEVLDAFAAGSPPATSAVERVAVDRRRGHEGATEDFSDVEDRLKGLGYME